MRDHETSSQMSTANARCVANQLLAVTKQPSEAKRLNGETTSDSLKFDDPHVKSVRLGAWPAVEQQESNNSWERSHQP